MNNPVIDTILSRRSVRRYQSRQITAEQLELLLAAACHAPSGSNSQSWLFTAVQNPEIIKTLNEEVRRGLQSLPAQENEYPARAAARKNSKNPDYHFCYHAPTLIIASNLADYGNAMADCAAALENILLAAHSLGLGSCWINQLTWLSDTAAVRDYLFSLGIPYTHRICGAAAIGYTKGSYPQAPLRKPGTIHRIL